MTAKIRLLLRELRTANDLSQEELAQALQLSRQSIISLERGEYLPSSPVLLALMEFFNCPIEQLVDGINIRYVQTEVAQPELNELPVNRALQQIPPTQSEWSPGVSVTAGAMNVHETETEYEIELQAPGYSEGEFNLEISDNTLTISGSKIDRPKEGKNLVRREWAHSEFSRSVQFAQKINEDAVEAKLENGTLTITAPKIPPVKPKIQKIEVKKK